MTDNSQIGAASFEDYNDLEALSVLTNYRRWIVDTFVPYLGGRAVEYGAGIGNISIELLPHVLDLELVEPCAPLLRKLSERMADRAGVHILQASVEEGARNAPASSFDTAIMVNVLEHIADDRATLAALHRILRPGGTLCLFVPAHEFLFSAYDRVVGHHRRYELSSLCAWVGEVGFEIARAHYFDLLGVVPWYVSMRLLGQTHIRPGLAGLYDALAVPIGRCLESRIAPPFGKNILLVARKPRSS